MNDYDARALRDHDGPEPDGREHEAQCRADDDAARIDELARLLRECGECFADLRNHILTVYFEEKNDIAALRAKIDKALKP